MAAGDIEQAIGIEDSSSASPVSSEAQKQSNKEEREKKQITRNADLHEAAMTGNEKKVKQLLDEGADVNSKHDKTDEKKLHQNESIMERLERQKQEEKDRLKIEAKKEKYLDRDGWTALHFAVSGSWTTVVNLLLKEKADVGAKSDLGWTPLHEAARRGPSDVVKTLVKANADTGCLDALHSWTPFYAAVEKGDLDVVELLLKEGADVKCLAAKQTPLHLAAVHGLAEVVDLLLKPPPPLGATGPPDPNPGADVHRTDKSGRTPLHLAARNGHEKVIARLLEANASPDCVDCYMDTPLVMAASFGHTGVVSLLKEKAGADIHHRNGVDQTALHKAAVCCRGHEREVERRVNCMKFLLEARADIHSKDKNGRTPWDLVETFGAPTRPLRMLLRPPASANLLH